MLVTNALNLVVHGADVVEVFCYCDLGVGRDSVVSPAVFASLNVGRVPIRAGWVQGRPTD